MLEQLADTMAYDQDRLKRMEALMKQLIEKEEAEGAIDAIDSKTLAPNALKDQGGKINPVDPSTLAPNALKDQGGKIDAVDPSTLAPNALKDQDTIGAFPSAAAPTTSQAGLTPDATQYTSAQDEEDKVEMEVEMALEKMIYTFMGVLVIAVIAGTAIGGICVLCIGKCCNRSQKKKLEVAKRRQEFQFRADSEAVG